MLAYVPVSFDLYRPVRDRLRWAMECLVAFADRDGKCFPSLSTFARFAAISRSAAGRHLAALVKAGYAKRTRQPGGVYHYVVDRRFLPRGVSQFRRKGVPDRATKEYVIKNTGFADDNFGVAPIDWPRRVRSLPFWRDEWGAKPGEPGCIVPPRFLNSKTF